MSEKKSLASYYMIPNPIAPNVCVSFDPELCVGCNTCVNVCPRDVLMPNPEKGKPPIVLRPDECWYCGSCVSDCPHPGANTINHALHMSVAVIWKRKDTGEICRLGMKNPPPPYTKPPVG